MNRVGGFIFFILFLPAKETVGGGSFTVAIITCIVWCFCLGFFFFSLWVWVFSLPEYRKLEPWSCVLFEISLFFLASFCFFPYTFTLLYLFYHSLLGRDILWVTWGFFYHGAWGPATDDFGDEGEWSELSDGVPVATENECWGGNGFLMRGKEEGLKALSSCRVFFPSTALQNVFLKMPTLLVIKFCVGF